MRAVKYAVGSIVFWVSIAVAVAAFAEEPLRLRSVSADAFACNDTLCAHLIVIRHEEEPPTLSFWLYRVDPDALRIIEAVVDLVIDPAAFQVTPQAGRATLEHPRLRIVWTPDGLTKELRRGTAILTTALGTVSERFESLLTSAHGQLVVDGQVLTTADPVPVEASGSATIFSDRVSVRERLDSSSSSRIDSQP